MGYQALLFCADERTVRGVTQVLNELDFSVESCSEPFAAVKRLTAQHFDALVVDCDNEQNAILLFKAARNSAANNASLSVAVVQGQAGIAKAFRLGASLVLTKPINVEQSKGTLRVARGLLRKEAGKAAAAAASAETQRQAGFVVDAEQSTTLPTADKTAAPIPPAGIPLTPSVPMATAALEVEQEPGPQPEPAEAALLEATPPPVLAKAATAAVSAPISQAPSMDSGARTERTVLADSTAEKSSQAVDKAAPGPDRTEVSQVKLAAAEVKHSRRPDISKSSGERAATAAAPAREIPPPVTDLFASKTASAKPAEQKPADAKKNPAKGSQAAVKKGASHAADKKGSAKSSWLEAARDQGPNGATGSKRNFFIAAVLVLGLAAAGYLAWPRLEPMLMSFPLVQKYLGQFLASPPAPTATAASAHAAAPVSSAISGTGGTQYPTAATEANGTTAPQADQSSSTPLGSSTSPATTSSQAGATTAPPSAATDTKINTTIARAQPTGGTTVTMASSPSAAVAKSSQPLRIPQTVSNGLLVKRTEPIYPSLARQVRVAGKVQLQANIAKDGSVTQIKALSGDPMLVHAAMDAVRQWKYRPYSSNGQPVEFETEITVNFNPSN